MKKFIAVMLFLLTSLFSLSQDSCLDPAGPITLNTQPPANCYIIPSVDTIDICFTFTSPGTILLFTSVPGGTCSSLQVTATLYDSACNVVSSSAFGIVFTIPGREYTWCLHYVCTGPHDTIFCPTYQDFSALPVDLLYFNGQYCTSKNYIKLWWGTATEKNAYYYDVQHNVSGAFAPLARVAAGGNSNVVLRYSYIDKNADPGINLYRLKQVDYDGVVHYSKVIAVVKPDLYSAIWEVYDLTGRFKGMYREDNLLKLLPGCYLLRNNERVRKYIR